MTQLVSRFDALGGGDRLSAGALSWFFEGNRTDRHVGSGSTGLGSAIMALETHADAKQAIISMLDSFCHRDLTSFLHALAHGAAKSDAIHVLRAGELGDAVEHERSTMRNDLIQGACQK